MAQPFRAVVLVLMLSLVTVQKVVAFGDILDDLLSLFFEDSEENDSTEMVQVHNKNATIKIDCVNVPCTLNVMCNNCIKMTMSDPGSSHSTTSAPSSSPNGNKAGSTTVSATTATISNTNATSTTVNSDNPTTV
ncbi:uncharacterized protein LOC128273782 [Anopheles cruzii]|uniref:uncharacterized protein LOC128273782 n=1 Tax=Anopheles cruzii TaxID=68878 RepID=UPI0022EC39F1|nr:uncharacterized protein LOC128273782 [Anopheles cruzii]